MTSQFVETFTCADGAPYEIKTRLNWLEQQRIDDLGGNVVFEFDGKAIKSLDQMQAFLASDDTGAGFEGLVRMELKTHGAEQNLARLNARLVGLNPRQVQGLPRAHVYQILGRIAQLEAEEAAELTALTPGNPTI
jgi:hypothetical protein